MAISCPIDGTAHADETATCRTCDRPLSDSASRDQAPPGTRWEYREQAVRIGLRSYLVAGDAATRARNAAAEELARGHIAAALQRLGRHGWQADHPTDLSTLGDADRVTWHDEGEGGFLGIGAKRVRVREAVTIRFKRLVPT